MVIYYWGKTYLWVRRERGYNNLPSKEECNEDKEEHKEYLTFKDD